MQINSITIQNFRCFEHFEATFNKELTVIVGNNGSGKSTLLDAVSGFHRRFWCCSRKIDHVEARTEKCGGHDHRNRCQGNDCGFNSASEPSPKRRKTAVAADLLLWNRTFVGTEARKEIVRTDVVSSSDGLCRLLGCRIE